MFVVLVRMSDHDIRGDVGIQVTLRSVLANQEAVWPGPKHGSKAMKYARTGDIFLTNVGAMFNFVCVVVEPAPIIGAAV